MTTQNEAFRDPSLPIDERIDDLLDRMSLEEKVGQMMQLNAEDDLEDEILHRHVGSILHTSPQRQIEAARLVEQTRLRIPLLVSDDVIRGFSFWPGATVFPEQLGMAQSWDISRIEQAGRITAVEASAAGEHQAFSPVLCIARDTRWGRVDETYGEDPYLIGEMGAAWTRGLQKNAKAGERLDKDALLATAKHFAGYSMTEGGRDASEADLTHRGLLSWFLPPFERVAKEGVGSFMLGYESIDGTPITLNHWLLHDVLRGRWGYTGTLVTDWDNVGQLVHTQKLVPDYAHAAALAVKAGNDMIMTTPKFFEGALEAVRTGLLTEPEIDEAVRRILALKFRLGLFEDPRDPDPERIKTQIGTAEHAQANLDVTRESLVLLHNDGTLPLLGDAADGNLTGDAQAAKTAAAAAGKRAAPKKIALVGPLIDDPQEQLGDWAGASGQADWMDAEHPEPRETITTVKDAFERLLPEGWGLATARGCDIVRLGPDPDGATFPDGQPRPKVATPMPADPAQIAEAVRAAQRSDVVVAVVGDTISLTGEGRSTATLELLGGQNALLDALAATGKPLVVVLMSGKPLILHEAAMNASALIWAPKPGMQGGEAIAETILGLVNPSGRLTITFPRHVGQLPVFYNGVRGQHGYRYADLTEEPLFRFGEGLGYTTFSYGDVRLSCNGKPITKDTRLGRDSVVRACIDVTDTGSRDGTEIVQLYVSDVVTSVTWADHELKAFRRVGLKAGETKTVTFDLPVADCTIVNADCERVVEPGDFEVQIGHSSRDTDLRKAVFTVGE